MRLDTANDQAWIVHWMAVATGLKWFHAGGSTRGDFMGSSNICVPVGVRMEFLREGRGNRRVVNGCYN